MNDLPDVAGSLFTNQYKAVKIEGKRLKPNALEGTGSVRIVPTCPCSCRWNKSPLNLPPNPANTLLLLHVCPYVAVL